MTDKKSEALVAAIKAVHEAGMNLQRTAYAAASCALRGCAEETCHSTTALRLAALECTKAVLVHRMEATRGHKLTPPPLASEEAVRAVVAEIDFAIQTTAAHAMVSETLKHFTPTTKA